MHITLAETIFGLTTAQFALMISGIAVIWTIRRWRMHKIKKAATAPALTERRATAQSAGGSSKGSSQAVPMREMNSEVQALLADIEETSRRLTAQLDNRYIRLEHLIAEADEKIKRLELLTTSPSSPAAAVPHISSPPEAAPPSPATAPARAPLSDAERTLQRLRHERGAPAPNDDPAYQPIYTLSDSGKSPREIAQQLQRQPGEIELILALRAH